MGLGFKIIKPEQDPNEGRVDINFNFNLLSGLTCMPLSGVASGSTSFDILSGSSPSNGLLKLTTYGGSDINIDIPKVSSRVISGFSTSFDVGNTLSLIVSGGSYSLEDITYTVASASNFTLTSGSSSFDRIDAVVGDGTGTLSILSGDTARNPSFPTIPESRLLVTYLSIPGQFSSTPSVYTTDLGSAVQSPGIVVPVGTTVSQISGQSFSDFIDNYVFPTVFSSINTAKSVTLGGVSTSTVEVGTYLSPTLTATFNRGDIDNGDGSSGPSLVGLANQYTFTGPGITTSVVVASVASSEFITTATTGYDAVESSFGSNTWTVVTQHDIGFGSYFDSKGNADTSLDPSRVAGTTSDNSNIITGRYYTFYDTGILFTTSSDVRGAGSKDFLNASNEGVFTITIPAFEPLVSFAVPAGKTVKVLYIESSSADVTGSFAVSTFNVDDAASNPVSYDIYTTTIGGGGYLEIANYEVTIS